MLVAFWFLLVSLSWLRNPRSVTMSKNSQESLSVEVGYKSLTMPYGNCTGLMKARGSLTGCKCPGDYHKRFLFQQVSIAFAPINRAA